MLFTVTLCYAGKFANWSPFRQLRFLTQLVYLNIYFSLFVYIGPEKPQWGVVNYVYIVLYIYCNTALSY